jgi:tRNA (guanine-N7-)-methyltransferase
MTRTNGASGGGGQQQQASAAGKLPRKRFYRARAHSNPLSDSHFPVPVSPDEVDLSQHYPRYFPADKGGGEEPPPPRIRFADVGCGFGGLLVGLSPLFPDTLMIGMELRDKVNCSYDFVLFFPLICLDALLIVPSLMELLVV